MLRFLLEQIISFNELDSKLYDLIRKFKLKMGYYDR